MDILEKIDNILNERKDPINHLMISELLGIVHKYSSKSGSNKLANREYYNVNDFIKSALDYIDQKIKKIF